MQNHEPREPKGAATTRPKRADAPKPAPPAKNRAEAPLDFALEEIETTNRMKEGFTGQER